MIIKLTSDFINNQLLCPEGKRRIEYVDTGGTGLYCEVRATSPGQGTYYLRWKQNGKTRHQKVGQTTEIDLDEARQRAKKLKANITLYGNARGDENAKATVPMTLDVFFCDHYMPHAKVHNRGWKKKSQMYNLQIKNVFGNKRLNQIKRREVSSWHIALREHGLSPAYSDRFLALLRNILNKAVEYEMLDKSPTMGVKMFNHDNRIDHRLSQEEMTRLLSAINNYKNRTVALIALFALSSGMRIGEILKIRHCDICHEKRLLQVPESNAKNKRSRTVVLNPSAMNVIDQTGTADKYEYLFVNRKTGKPYTCIRRAWQKIKMTAGLPHYRVHDLRHEFASLLLGQGVSVLLVKELLGHAQINTTVNRYAHLATDELLSASSLVSDAINAAMPDSP